jgi:hypothetical protein
MKNSTENFRIAGYQAEILTSGLSNTKRVCHMQPLRLVHDLVTLSVWERVVCQVVAFVIELNENAHLKGCVA